MLQIVTNSKGPEGGIPLTKLFHKKVLPLAAAFLVALTGTAYAAEGIHIDVTDNGSTQSYTLPQDTTVEEFLADEGLGVTNKDLLSLEASHVLVDGDELVITRAIPVTVYIDGVPKLVYTTDKTAGALMTSLSRSMDLQLTLDGTSDDKELKADDVLTATTTTTVSTTSTVAIPYETQIVESEELEQGIEVIAQGGVDGEKQVTVTQTLRGGQVIDETVTEVVTREAVPAIIKTGAKAATVMVNGTAMAYTTALEVKATAYTPYDAGCTGITSTGTKAGYGTLAVDPSVIPYGSRVYVPGYGVCVASDCGGAIKGNRIDVCYESLTDALNWGVRNVTIYILE